MWILLKIHQLRGTQIDLQSRGMCRKWAEMNELARVLSLHTWFCYHPTSGYKITASRSHRLLEKIMNFLSHHAAQRQLFLGKCEHFGKFFYIFFREAEKVSEKIIETLSTS